MTRETLTHLNTNTLIGMTDQRGAAWHYRAEEQGEETNHYLGPIPVDDVHVASSTGSPSPAASRSRPRRTSRR